MKRYKFQRGSGWCEFGNDASAGAREYCPIDEKDSIVGFRIVMGVTNEKAQNSAGK